jgi:zinc protease
MPTETFRRVTLSNGLLVLLKEIHTAPLISQWIWYRVGSRNERPGLTGVSHWVEHMQFKGTPNHPPGSLDKAIARLGGYWNALTYLDWTTYFETMPAAAIDLALELEADRMLNSRFDPQEVASERTVIISERQGNENEPLFRLGEAVQRTAFREHSYRHEVIGDPADLESMQRDDLFEHYRSFYTPNNAVLSVAGDFQSEVMLQSIEDLYKAIPAASPPTFQGAAEPEQEVERYTQVQGPGDTIYLQIAHHAPAATHPDFFAFTVLDSLLTGPSNLNMFGGGISNKTSRLYQALVDRDLAIGVYGGIQATLDPFLHNVTIIIHPEHSTEEVLKVFDEEVERLQAAPPPQDDLERAVKQARALFAYGSESITNQAFWLGYSEMFATYSWFTSYLDRLTAITPQEVQRVAQEYFRRPNRTVGIYLPESADDGE